jgi:hypothetical protein
VNVLCLSLYVSTNIAIDIFTLAENVAHNLYNSNNTAPSIGIIRVKIDAANGKVKTKHCTEYQRLNHTNLIQIGGEVRFSI